jgi:hypothetical protein
MLNTVKGCHDDIADALTVHVDILGHLIQRECAQWPRAQAHLHFRIHLDQPARASTRACMHCHSSMREPPLQTHTHTHTHMHMHMHMHTVHPRKADKGDISCSVPSPGNVKGSLLVVFCTKRETYFLGLGDSGRGKLQCVPFITLTWEQANSDKRTTHS